MASNPSTQKKKKFNSGESGVVPKQNIQFDDLKPSQSNTAEKGFKKEQFNKGGNFNKKFDNADHSNKNNWKSNNTQDNRNSQSGSKSFKSQNYSSGQKNYDGTKGRNPTPYYSKGNNSNYSTPRQEGSNSYQGNRGSNSYSKSYSDRPSGGYEKKDGPMKKQMNLFASKMSSKNNKTEDRIKCIDEILVYCGESLSNVIFKKTGSRLIQACLKYGNKAQREDIFLKIINSDIGEVVKSTYGRFLMKKILIYVKDKALIPSLTKYLDHHFFSLLNNENSIKAIHDYLEEMTDTKRLQF